MTNIRTIIQCCFAILIVLVFSSCDNNEDTTKPVAAFDLPDELIAVNEPLTVVNQSTEAENINWYVNDELRIELFNNSSPILFFESPGEYEVKLVASSQGISDSIIQVINVEYLTITSISFINYLEDFKNWDPDSTGVKQNPDVLFRRQIGADILFEGVTHWNPSQDDLPIEIAIPNDWKFGFNSIPITEFLFYDDDFTNAEPMFRSSFGQDFQYDTVFNNGQITVQTGAVEYVIGFSIL